MKNELDDSRPAERPATDGQAPALRLKMGDFAEQFGGKVRAAREARGQSLRGLAAEIQFEPSFLSKIERGIFPPPGEERTLRLAYALEMNADELLAAGGRVAYDLIQIILARPIEMAALLRAATNLSPADVQALVVEAERAVRRVEGSE